MNIPSLRELCPRATLPERIHGATYLISDYSVTINPEKLSKEEEDLLPYLALRQLLNSPALSEQEFNYLNNLLNPSSGEILKEPLYKVQVLNSNKKVTTDPDKYFYIKITFILYPFDWVGKNHKVRFCQDKEAQYVKRKMLLANKIKACTRVGYWKLKKGK